MSLVLLRGGHVLTMDPDLGEIPVGDVLVADGRIVAVGTDLDPADAEVVDVRGEVVLPGLVDSHRHLWQSPLRGFGPDLSLGAYLPLLLGTAAGRITPDDLRLAGLLGAVEALDAGVTTVFDYGNATRSPAHATAAQEGLAEAGIRAVFGHGDPSDRAGLERLAAAKGLVTGALAVLSPEHGPLDEVARHIRLARKLGLVTSMHIGCGTGGTAARPVLALADAGLLGPDLHFVHGNTSSDADLRALVDGGAGITVTPTVEMMMGHGHPAYARLTALGARPALGVDVTLTTGPNLLDQARAILWSQRQHHNEQLLADGRDPWTLRPAAGDLLHAVTLGGAAAIGLADRVGSLTPGKRADILVLSGLSHLTGTTEPGRVAGAVVAVCGTPDVRDVLVDGRYVKRDGRLLDHDLSTLRATADEVARRVLP